MLDSIKNVVSLKMIDKDIIGNNFDVAMDKLNTLIKCDFKPSVTHMKRGLLCKKLLMYEEAYSDFTYIIEHCADKKEAYYQRAYLNFEISNFYEAILDCNMILSWDADNFEISKIKFLSLVYSKQDKYAGEFVMKLFSSNKYKALHFIFNEVAKVLANDEYARGLRLLEIIEKIDRDNPIKMLKEATIYGLANNIDKQNELLGKIDTSFPKYFVSHFKFMDMYQDKDLYEISFLLELSIFDKFGLFAYPLKILEGYKNYLEGHITDAKNCFEEVVNINPKKPEGYVLLAQTLQLMSGYENPDLINLARENYMQAESIYRHENLPQKAEDMRKQIHHLNAGLQLF